jgi:hypothetical protein
MAEGSGGAKWKDVVWGGTLVKDKIETIEEIAVTESQVREPQFDVRILCT